MVVATSLLSLPAEIIADICDHLCRASPFESLPSVSRLETARVSARFQRVREHHVLDALSRTCRAVRPTCCARMFERIQHSYYRDDEPPCAILRYVRILGIPVPRLYSSDDSYLKMFSRMPNLSDIVWTARDTVMLGDRGLRLLSLAPTLQSLTLINFKLVVRHPLNIQNLRALDLSQPRRNFFTVTAEEIYTERVVLESILAPLRYQLRVLRLPGESSRTSFLSHEPWPRLSELVIRGGPPLSDAPSGAVLRAMPRLRVLAMAFERFPASRVVMLHPAALPFPLLDLTRLSIADGDPRDAVFSHLSDALTELSLRDAPRYYWRRQLPGRHGPALLGCCEALHILRTVPTRNIQRLELVVRDDGMQAQLLAVIASLCTSLVFLELHLYAADDAAFVRLGPEDVDFPTERIAKALAPLPRLRALRLNLDLALSGPEQKARHMSPMGTHEQTFERWLPFLAAQAQVVAHVLPRLDHVAFLTTQAVGGNGWSTWYVVHSPDGAVELRYQEATGPYGNDCPRA